MKQIKIKSPTRIDLIGGFLDIPPIYSLIDDCHVINCSIPVFSSVALQSGNKASGFSIDVQSPDGRYKKTFSSIKACLKSSDREIVLLKLVLTYWLKQIDSKKLSGLLVNSVLHIESEAPVGSGLGGSSSLCVNLNKLFLALLKQRLNDHQMIQLCRDMETKLLHFPAGVQDYIPALSPQTEILHIIHFTPYGPQWKSKKLSKRFFKDHVLLVDTKIKHHSGQSNWKILKKVIEKDKLLLKGLNQLRDNSLKMALSCESEGEGDWMPYLQAEYKLKKKYFPGWSNKRVSEIMDLILKSGASAVKLCGAGGGGCMLVFCKNIKSKNSVKAMCIKNNISIILSW